MTIAGTIDVLKSKPLSEITHDNLEDRIDPDDRSDPMVEQLRFMARSPAAHDGCFGERARWMLLERVSRTMVRGLFAEVEWARDNRFVVEPSHPYNIYYRWLDAVEKNGGQDDPELVARLERETLAASDTHCIQDELEKEIRALELRLASHPDRAKLALLWPRGKRR